MKTSSAIESAYLVAAALRISRREYDKAVTLFRERAEAHIRDGLIVSATISYLSSLWFIRRFAEHLDEDYKRVNRRLAELLAQLGMTGDAEAFDRERSS